MKYIHLHIAQTTNAIKPNIIRDDHKFKKLINSDNIFKFVIYSIISIIILQLLRFIVI